MKARDVFPYWADARDLLVQAVERLDDDQLDWHPHGLERSIRGILHHVVSSEHEWLDLLAGQESDPLYEGNAAGGPSLAEILGLIDSACLRIEPFLDMDVEDLREQRLKVGSGAEFNCYWVLTRIYEHEAHHRGQVFMLMRMQGLEPPEL